MTPLTPPSAPGASKFLSWKRPEGKMGMAINLLIGAVLFYFWGSIVPFVLDAAEKTLNLVLVCIALAAILYLLFDKNFRRFVWFLYRAAIRWLTARFVDLDPIGVLKTILEKVRERKTELESANGDIRGQRIKLERSIAGTEQEYATSMANLKAAKKALADVDPEKRRRAERIEKLESKQVDRLDIQLKQQRQHLIRYDFVVDRLTRYSEVCDDTILDMARDIKFREQDRDQSNSFGKGMRAALGILRGMPEDTEMQEMAVAALERDYTQRLGEVENILDITKNVIVQADFADAGAIEKAAVLLENWPPKAALSAGQEQTATVPAPPVRIDNKYF